MNKEKAYENSRMLNSILLLSYIIKIRYGIARLKRFILPSSLS